MVTTKYTKQTAIIYPPWNTASISAILNRVRLP